MYRVKNVDKSYQNHKYVVIRDCFNEPDPYKGYWYWGAYDNLVLAQTAAKECGNGIVVETEDVEVEFYN